MKIPRQAGHGGSHLKSQLPGRWRREDHSSRLPRAKVSEILSQKPSWVWWLTAIIPAMWEAEVGGSWSKASTGQNPIPYLKNELKAVRHKAPSSKPQCHPQKPNLLSMIQPNKPIQIFHANNYQVLSEPQALRMQNLT
jgi:hypothetical protein